MNGIPNKTGSTIEKFKKLIKEYQVEPVERILHQFKSLDAGCKIFDLSDCPISNTMCLILSKILEVDNNFEELKFSNCFLSDEGLTCLLGALCKNYSIKNLDLKGNTIQGNAMLMIGKLLRENNTLQRLHLEWNKLGLLTESLIALTQGLAVNQSLRELDLKNNILSHIEAAHIAEALGKNNVLEILDLQWNNMGHLGGRAILAALQTNRTIHKVELRGNNVPLELLQAIDIALKNNNEFQHTMNEHKQREALLHRELQQMGNFSSSQIENLTSELKRQEKDFLHHQTLSSTKLGQLQETLDDHKSTVQILETKCSASAKSLELALDKQKELTEQLAVLQQENADLRTQHLNILHRERKEHSEKEEDLVKEIKNYTEQVKRLECRVSEFEILSASQKQRLGDTQIELSQLNKSFTAQLASANEQNVKQQKQHSEQVQNLLKKIEHLENVNSDQLSQIREQQNDLKIIEKQKKSVEDELSSMTVQRMADRRINESQVEDFVRRESLAREKYELKLEQLALTNKDLQEKCNVLHQDLEVQKKLCTHLEQVLETKEKLGLTLQQAQQELAESHKQKGEIRLSMELLQKEMKQMKDHLSDQTKNYEAQLMKKELEITSLKNNFQLKEQHWQQIYEKDAQRVAVLNSAVLAYLQGSGQSSVMKPIGQ